MHVSFSVYISLHMLTLGANAWRCNLCVIIAGRWSQAHRPALTYSAGLPLVGSPKVHSYISLFVMSFKAACVR